jgi:hypothetical protein
MNKVRGMFGVSSLFFLLALLALFFLQIEGFADDPGLGWHFATGRWIVENSSLPSEDPFLYSQAGKFWLPEQWFADVLLYVTYSFSGWSGLYAAGGAIFFLTYAAFLYPGLLRISSSVLAACLATLLAFKMAQVHFVLRPLIFNFPLFALTLILCWQYPARFKGWWVGLVTFGIFAVWANMHPAFVLGLVLMGMKFVSLALESAVFRSISRTELVCFASFILLAVLGSLLTPFRVDLYPHILWHSKSELVSKVFVEWRPTVLNSFEGELLLSACVISLLGIILARPRNIFFYLSCSLFIPWAFLSVRILPFCGMVALPLMAAGFNGIGRVFSSYVKSRFSLIYRACCSIYQREQMAAFAPTISLFVLMGILACSFIFQIVPGNKPWAPVQINTQLQRLNI